MSAETVLESGGILVEKVVTSGVFALDGGEWEVDNNVWLIGDDRECLVVDAAHDADAIREAVGERTLVGVVCTHAHNDHVNAVAQLREATGAPAYLHPGDRMLWDETVPAAPDRELADGDEITVAGTRLVVLHTPGHSPGSCCLHAPELGVLLSGDTLFSGGPGATGRSYSDFGTIVDSIRERLLTLPADTRVLTGHGDTTTVGDEAPHLPEWIARGH